MRCRFTRWYLGEVTQALQDALLLKSAVRKTRTKSKKSKDEANASKPKPAKKESKATGKAKTKAKPVMTKGVVLGCSKCRGDPNGCGPFRNPKFGGKRWQRV